MDLLLIESTSFKRFLQAQVSAQDNTTNQFNDAEKYFNPFIAEDNKGTESKEHSIKNDTNINKNITENRLEANDELKDFDNSDNNHRNSSERVQNI